MHGHLQSKEAMLVYFGLGSHEHLAKSLDVSIGEGHKDLKSSSHQAKQAFKLADQQQ